MSGVPRAGSAEDCVGPKLGKTMKGWTSSELNEHMCGFLYRHTHMHTHSARNPNKGTNETPFSATVS